MPIYGVNGTLRGCVNGSPSWMMDGVFSVSCSSIVPRKGV